MNFWLNKLAEKKMYNRGQTEEILRLLTMKTKMSKRLLPFGQKKLKPTEYRSM